MKKLLDPVDTPVYNILNICDGGPGAGFALYVLRSAGIKAQSWDSSYVGHRTIAVPKRFRGRALRILRKEGAI